jgi:hypothetical protein
MEPQNTCPTCKQLTGSWTVDDPRMWKEQCRVGDVAFQHLFCTSKDKPLPNWVIDGLPMMYHTLSEIKRLKTELDSVKEQNDIYHRGLNSGAAKIMLLNEEIRKARQKIIDLETLANMLDRERDF